VLGQSRPKLLLGRGSATLVGISAREIQSQAVPTINRGTHAAWANATFCTYAQTVAQPGDTSLAMEYETLQTMAKSNGPGHWSSLLDYRGPGPAFVFSIFIPYFLCHGREK